MKRREFLALLGGATLVGPRATLAQTPGRIYHLGTLAPALPLADTSPSGKIVVRALAEHGYILGQNLTFDARGAMGDVAKLPSLLGEGARRRCHHRHRLSGCAGREIDGDCDGWRHRVGRSR